MVPVDAFLHGVDIDEGHGVPAEQQRGATSQACQQQPAHLLQLEHVPPGERPQERPQRRRGADPAEQGWHRAMPQQVHDIDAVRLGNHPSGQARNLRMRVHPARAADPDMLFNQVRQACPLRERPLPGPGLPATRDPGHQTSRRSSPARATIALARCPLRSAHGSFSNSHRPVQRASFALTRPNATLFTRWIEA
jgi:hypothetical protein